jgi:HK97 family phage major capsid protein
MRIKELREKRAKLVADARAEYDKITDKTTPAEAKEIEARFDAMMAEADKLKGQIERLEKLEDNERDLNEAVRRNIDLNSPGNQPGTEEEQRKARNAAHRAAFMQMVRGGLDTLAPEQRQLMAQFRAQIPQSPLNGGEQRAQTITTTAGGHTIPTDLVRQIEVSMLAFGGIRSVADVLKTSGGNPLKWPTVNDTTNKATLTTINTQTTETDLTFGQVSLDAYAFRSLILVPYELLQDTGIDLEGLIAKMLGERIARGTADYFAAGTGSNQPQGIVGASGAGTTAAASNAVAYNDLVELEHSVDPAYRVGARFLMKDSTLKLIKKLVDSQNRPLWLPGVAVREPDTILGYPYTIDQALPAVEASAKSILFGNIKKFMVRDVSEMIMLRLVERYADYGQVGFFVFSRHDSEMLDAGTDPVKHLVHPSP